MKMEATRKTFKLIWAGSLESASQWGKTDLGNVLWICTQAKQIDW